MFKQRKAEIAKKKTSNTFKTKAKEHRKTMLQHSRVLISIHIGQVVTVCKQLISLQQSLNNQSLGTKVNDFFMAKKFL